MSDETTTDQVDTPAPEAEVVETSTPAPWGDDFNPERAWSTITHLRGVEKELEPKAKSYERLTGGEDLDAFKELAERYGFDIPDEEPEEEFGEDPRLSEYDKKIAAIEQWKSEREAQEAANAFISDVNGWAKEKGMASDDEPLDDEKMQFIFLRANANPKGLNQESAKEAFDAFVKLFPEEVAEPPKAPRKPISGQAASQVPDLETTADIVAHIKRQLSPEQQ